jgi:hypothetical protein
MKILFSKLHQQAYFIPMNPSKEDIKAWLKNEGHSREWLGGQCGGLQKRAVDNWLSSPREIPAGSLEIIRRLMADDAEKRKNKADPLHHLIVTVPLEEFRTWEQAALLKQTTTTEYCVEAIRDAYQADMQLTAMPAAERPFDQKQG